MIRRQWDKAVRINIGRTQQDIEIRLTRILKAALVLAVIVGTLFTASSGYAWHRHYHGGWGWGWGFGFYPYWGGYYYPYYWHYPYYSYYPYYPYYPYRYYYPYSRYYWY